MTLREISEESGKTQNTIREYIRDFFPEIKGTQGKRLELSSYQTELLLELLNSLTTGEFAKKYDFSYHHVINHIRDHYPDITKVKGKIIIDKEYEMAIKETLTKKLEIGGKYLNKRLAENKIELNRLYRELSLCSSCYYWIKDSDRCEFYLRTCFGKRYINKDGK